MYEKDPNQGAVNAAITSVRGVFVEDGVLPDARPSTPDLEGSAQGGISTKQAVEPGADPVLMGLTAISPDDLPADAEQAPLQPEPLQGGITGVVWRDFSPGGGTPGKIEEQEVGIPGVTVELRGQDGGSVASATTNPDGTFAFEDVEDGQYRVAIGPKTFAEPFGGVSLARAEPHHARDHDRLHLGDGRLRDGHHRRGPLRHPARRPRGRAHGRRLRVAGLPPRDRAAPRTRSSPSSSSRRSSACSRSST